MIKTIFIVLLSFFSIQINSQTVDEKTEKLLELDEKYSTELLTQIIEDEKENYLISDCISELPRVLTSSMYFDYEYLQKLLKIKNTSHFELQLNLFKEFKITPKLVPNKNILTQKHFENFDKKAKDDGINSMFWLKKECTNGYCSITKPIFNESFDLAYVEVAKFCGGMCNGGEFRIYEFVNGNWVIKEMLINWIN